MAWLEAASNFLATLSYKLIRGDSGEGGGRRRETQHNYYGTEWNSQQYPYDSEDFGYGYGYGYGHGGDQYYGQGGSEKQYYRGNPQEQQYSYHIRDENGESEDENVAASQRVGKKGAWRTMRRRIDFEESGMRTKQYVDYWSGKPVVEQTPYRSRMYEENQYIPFQGEEDTGMNADARDPRELAKRKRKKKKW